jgi:microcystin-dependent protein
MTVSSNVARNDFVGTGGTATYAYSFRIFASSDLEVTTRTSANVQALLVLTTDYTVTGVGAASGGTITLVAGNLASGSALTIRRVRPRTQLTDVRNQGPFLASLHEDAFDHLLMLVQQLQDQLDRCVKLPVVEAGETATTVLPAATGTGGRASKTFAWDSSGNISAATSMTTGSLTVSAFIETLIDDATAAAARTTLGFSGASGTVAAANVAADIITGQTSEATVAGGDEVLINDLSAGALRRMTVTNLLALGGGTAVPAGALFPYGGSSAPSGYLLCDGAAVSRATYAALFAVVGTAFGAGDGSTTFNLPDMRGRIPLGEDDMGGTPANRVTDAQADTVGGFLGAETHVLLTAEMPAHTHAATVITGSGILDAGGNYGTTSATGSTGGGGAHNNLQPCLTVKYIVKT